MQRKQLFEAIVADPADDRLRLVYADALTEADDPRGEFITVQCRLASGRVKGAAAVALKAREEALLEAHRSEWFGPFEKWLRTNDSYGLSQLKVQRGFVSQCRVQLTEPDTLKVLFEKAPLIERLQLRGGLTNIEAPLSQLTHLEAEGDCASSMAAFLNQKPLPRLRQLSLGFGYLSQNVHLALAAHTGLEVLEVLRGRAVTKLTLPASLERLSWLGELCSLGGTLPKLTSVYLGTAPSAKVVEALVRLAPRLESLGVAGPLVGLQPLFDAEWPKLRHLDVSGVTLGPTGAQLIAKLRAPVLESLDVTNTRLKPEGAWVVLRSPLMKTLRQLSLRANRLGDADLADLPKLKHQLQLLNLKKNPLGAVFLKKLSKVFTETKLSR